MTEVAERSEHAVRIGAGTLYGTLKRLLEAQLVEEGLNSGPASPLVEADIEAIKVRILAQARAKPK